MGGGRGAYVSLGTQRKNVADGRRSEGQGESCIKGRVDGRVHDLREEYRDARAAVRDGDRPYIRCAQQGAGGGGAKACARERD